MIKFIVAGIFVTWLVVGTFYLIDICFRVYPMGTGAVLLSILGGAIGFAAYKAHKANAEQPHYPRK